MSPSTSLRLTAFALAGTFFQSASPTFAPSSSICTAPLRRTSTTMAAAAPPPAYAEMTAILREISSLDGALGVINWDQQVMLPPGASSARGRQKAVLASVIHERSTSAALDAAIAACEADMAGLPDDFARANVRDARRSFRHTAGLSKALVMEREEAESKGYSAWTKAREKNDFASFAPVLEDGLRVFKKCAEATRPGMEPYDAAIDMFERGMTAKRLEEIFDGLQGPLKTLRDQVVEAKKSAEGVKEVLKGGEQWDVDAQARLCKKIAEKMSFDFDHGRLDVSLHPFTGGSGPEDTRITTRYSSEVPWEGLMGTIHEVGHALYEQGRNEPNAGLPVSEALSMGAHESQSLFWERMIGQSPAFWKAVLPLCQEEFSFAKNLTGEDFSYAVNQVDPSGLIRVDSDELFYPFHIIMRFQIERGLFDGSITTADLPKVWAAKMKDFFGLDVPSDTVGCLQDVHWPSLSYGYFPSYTLGAMTAAQLYSFMDRKAMPGMEQRIEKGEFGEIKKWLNENFHVKGSLYPSLDELLVAVTGEPLRPQYFMDYLTKKYTAMYNL